MSTILILLMLHQSIRAHDISIVSKIDICEARATGLWDSFSYTYPDGVGITRANWISLGGNPNKGSSIWYQVVMEFKFVNKYHIAFPDQHGCSGAY